jgi:signal transduction histidine kinase
VSDVSCRFFDMPLRDLRERGIDAIKLTAGTAYTPAFLAKKDERVEWSALVQMMENGRALWTREQLLALGARSAEGPLVRFVGTVARLRFSVGGFFKWVTAPDGVGSQMVTAVKTTANVDRADRITLDFEMAAGCAPNEEFFLITQGTYEVMPRILGAPSAKVTNTPTPTGARFVVEFVEPRGVLVAVRKVVSWPFTVRRAGHELADAHTSLVDRYRELETARAQVEAQRARLEVAYQLGQRIWRSNDTRLIAEAAIESLRAFPTVRGVRITSAEIPTSGGETKGAAEIDMPLGEHGTLEVWCESDEVRLLVDLVAPTISLALDNARYQTGLEKLVEQRTTELRTVVEQLREAQGARARFFANISHEIRTPLSLVMLAAADVEARAATLLDARSKQSLGSITDAARKLLRLVDELLLLAAGQENKLAIHPQPTDIAALLAGMLGGWRPAVESAGLSLESRLAGALTAMVDPVAIERVASNLVSNAVKYTPRGGSIAIELADEPDGLRLSVLDTGPGIDADLASRLFGRFERTATEVGAKTIGTGIGLSLVKQLVEAHGGTVQALPRATGGTEMRVVLPVALKTDAVATATAPRLASRTGTHVVIKSGDVFPAKELSGGTILVAEDDPALAHSIATMLSENYTVVVGLDGEAALALVKPHQPQLLITDVDMPKMNGIELAKRFREVTGDQLAPIVILSAVMDLGTRVAGLEAGAVDYVGKPFDRRELEARVKAQFRMRDLAVRLHRAEQLSSLGILTSGLAHELRNPANGIVNAIAPIREMLPADVPKGVIALMEVLEDCAKQIGFLSRQLLGFRGTATLELQPARVPELVQRAVSMAQRSLGNIEIRTQLQLERSVMCAPPLFVQVLTNLIENGAHAAGTGGWVQVMASLADGRILVEVTDSGPGVPQGLRERIFEPFFTTKPQGVGTGLGLSVARAIVQRHGGVLEVRERGQRAAFVIELPDSPAA